MVRPSAVLPALSAIAVLALAGCTGSRIQTYDSSVVVDHPDQFVLSGSVGNFSKDTTYTWHTSSGHPTATWSGYVSAGSVAVTVRDQLGQTLYQRTYTTGSASSGNEPLSGTVGGDWTVRIQYQHATASLSLTLQ